MIPFEQSDSEILRLILEGDDQAFVALFNKYFERLSKTAYLILKDSESAKDITQEFFYHLFEEKEKFNSINNLKNYLFISIKNLALNKLKNEDNQQRLNISYINKIDLESQNSTMDYNNFLEIVKNEISTLPPKCRLIFSYSRFEGLSNTEISEILDISKSTVEKQIYYAFKHLREKLKDNPSLLVLVNSISLASTLL